MFSQPTAGSDFKAKDHIGHLLLMYPREIRQGIVTKYGPSDALSLDLVVLTDQAGPRLETQVLFFQKGLMNSLKGNIGGDAVLARLGQGTATPGQDPPYILIPFTEQEGAFATQYLQSVGGNPFQSATNFQAPAPAPVPAVPAAPLPTAAPAAAYPAAYPPAYPATPQAPFPAAPGGGVGVPAAAAPVAQQYPAPQPPQVPQQQYAPAPVPAAAPQHLVQLPNGQMGTPEQAAAIQALGMNGMPPAAPAQ
jgi:hypothetical protein